jgi:catechol 2,3-dioxygenase-like lactoylglutathione lyase family enzyme
MKRLHVHVHVGDLDQSIGFYSTLFGARPTKVEPGYAKWMLEDPRVNFAISTGPQPGLSHLGIQAESNEELAVVAGRAKEAGDSVLIEENASCCYAKSNKAWVDDPAGLRWETFYTFGDITTYGQSADERRIESKTAAPIVLSSEVASAASCGCSTAAKQEPVLEKVGGCCG